MFLQLKQNKRKAVNGPLLWPLGRKEARWVEKGGRKCGEEERLNKRKRGKEEGRPILPEPQYPPSSEAPEHSVQHRLSHRPEISVCWQSALPAPVWCYYNSNPLVKTISARRLQHPYSFGRLNNLHCKPAVPSFFFPCCGEERGHRVYLNHVKVTVQRRPLGTLQLFQTSVQTLVTIWTHPPIYWK